MSFKQTLEAIGIPVSLASKVGEILEKERQDPNYKRTTEEKEIVRHAHTWWVAQGMRTIKE